MFSSLSPFLRVLAPFPWCDAVPIQGVSPQSNLSGNSYRDQRCVCVMILHSIKLNVMINHHGYQIKNHGWTPLREKGDMTEEEGRALALLSHAQESSEDSSLSPRNESLL